MGAAVGALVSFAQLKRGMVARVVRISEHTEASVRLQEMGLTEGVDFRVVKVAPFGDPVEIDLRGYRLCLRKRESVGFELESVG